MLIKRLLIKRFREKAYHTQKVGGDWSVQLDDDCLFMMMMMIQHNIT